MPYPTDFAVQAAQIKNASSDEPVKHNGFTIKTWHIEGYGWTGEIEDSGSNTMPPWMNPPQAFEYRWQAVEFMKNSIDSYLVLVSAEVAR